jgi:3-hydroxyacyl-[acyl-carrier-protein] dehydratase
MTITAPLTTLDSDGIRALLPHSWPFLYLDRVLELEPGESATGLKNVTVAEPHFAGHFPRTSVMPGVLIVEACAQLVGVVLLSRDDPESRDRALLASIDKFRFRAIVRPGDQLVLAVERQASFSGVHNFRAFARVDGNVVAEGRLSVAA